MANVLTGNPIVLDTFSSAIDLSDYFPNGMEIISIEWSMPTDTSHTFTILAGGSSGSAIFRAQCTTANQNIIKYLSGEHGVTTKPLYLAAAAGNEKQSGQIIIHLSGPGAAGPRK